MTVRKRFRNICRLLLLGWMLLVPALLAAQAPARSDIESVAGRYIKSSFEGTHHSVSSIEQFGVSDESLLWLVTLAPEGWIIISGDKKSRAVLAFSETGEFSRGVDPADEMLSFYELQIDDLRSNGELSPDESWERAEYYDDIVKSKSSVTIKPLIVVNWGQGAGWNMFCPEDAEGPGGHVYVGCVAVAMAQAMSVFGYPAFGSGSHSYMHNLYGIQEVDFGAASYNWDAMSSNKADTINAKLLYHLAVSVNMNFGPDGSSASTSRTAESLNSWFLYSEDAYYTKRSSYAINDWIASLINQLEKGYPLIYRGESADGKSAHAFNIDGVKPGNLFHLNWGWSGSSNGYFTIDDLTPGTRNYSYDNGAVFNLKPQYYPTGITMSNDIVPEDEDAGAFIGSVSVMDEASDNQYEITLVCDSSFIDEGWVMDYILSDDILSTGRTFVSGETESDTIIFIVNDIYGNSIEVQQILRFGSATSVLTVATKSAGELFYPNPASGIIHIRESYLNRLSDITLYSLSGRRLFTSGSDFSGTISLASFRPGIYFLVARMRDGSEVRSKVIKN
ncbi:MAG: thiol protease/hemagglutinin PrtT [Bacteroidales bacterium]|nr:thiol protease/hemagglutinin PrtT [Bacteroidales bacterium]